jgi:hypothetical protein
MVRLVVLALAACSDPSPLDEVPDSTAELEAWDHIAAAASPLDAARPHFVAAGDYNRDESSRIRELETWAEAGGRLPYYAVSDPNDAHQGVSGIAFTIVRSHADDDRALEAALYLAQQLRRDQGAFINGLIGTGIAQQAIAHRRHPPGFAARYAPTDDEFFHILAGEALWARTHSPLEGDRMWRWVAEAPRDRNGLLALLLQRAVLEPDSTSEITLIYAIKMYTAVDAYQHWLAR